jgi:hypothetical protein
MADEKPGDGLQFERAEYDTAAAKPTCATCGKGIWSTYYAVNGQVTCEACKVELQERANRGSSLGRFLKATLFGLGAGLLGAGVWYAVRATTGYELGLIAIGVGFAVGAAVRAGGQGRGGWRYQALAMFLTYASIVSTYVPDVVKELMKAPESSTEAAAVATPATGVATPATAEAPPPEPTPSPASPTDATPAAADPPLSAGAVVIAVGVFAIFVFGIAFAAPFLGGVENLMGLLIIGIALYEAWKINRKTALEISGPHRVGTAPATPTPSPTPEA